MKIIYAIKKKISDKIFTIKHYVGNIEYNITNFRNKNKDILTNNIVKFLINLNYPFIKEINIIKMKNLSDINTPTISYQFRNQLVSLLNIIKNTNKSYIKCLNPNNRKQKKKIDDYKILNQLNSNGIINSFEILKNGYRVRYKFLNFFKKYKLIFKSGDLKKNNDLNTYLINKEFKIISNNYSIGKTKIFLKKKFANSLDSYVYNLKEKYAKKIQNFYKIYREKKKRKQKINSIKLFQSNLKLINNRNKFIKIKKLAKNVKMLYFRYKFKKNIKILKRFFIYCKLKVCNLKKNKLKYTNIYSNHLKTNYKRKKYLKIKEKKYLKIKEKKYLKIKEKKYLKIKENKLENKYTFLQKNLNIIKNHKELLKKEINFFKKKKKDDEKLIKKLSKNYEMEKETKFLMAHKINKLLIDLENMNEQNRLMKNHFKKESKFVKFIKKYF